MKIKRVILTLIILWVGLQVLPFSCATNQLFLTSPTMVDEMGFMKIDSLPNGTYKIEFKVVEKGEVFIMYADSVEHFGKNGYKILK